MRMVARESTDIHGIHPRSKQSSKREKCKNLASILGPGFCPNDLPPFSRDPILWDSGTIYGTFGYVRITGLYAGNLGLDPPHENPIPWLHLETCHALYLLVYMSGDERATTL